MMTIQHNSVVYLHYAINDSEGNIIEDNFKYAPEPYLHGALGLLPKLEEALTNKKAGDTIELFVSAENAYGAINNSLIYKVGAEEVEEESLLEPNALVRLKNGHEAIVVAKDDTSILIDLNHPLAGKDLYFKIQVVSIRAATEKEILNGYPITESATCCGGSGCC